MTPYGHMEPYGAILAIGLIKPYETFWFATSLKRKGTPSRSQPRPEDEDDDEVEDDNNEL